MARDQAPVGTDPGSGSKSARPAPASRVESELEAMALMGKRNLDAACSINRLAVDCIQRCAERQADVWGKFSTNALSLLGLFGVRTHEDLPTVQSSPVITDTIDLILGHMREVSELIARSNQDALDVIRSRSEACFKEVEETTRRNISTLLDSRMQPPASRGQDTPAPGKRPGSSDRT